MPSETINMHGKIYDLLDNIERTKDQAQEKAIEIRANGQVAFLNPQKRKDKQTNYWIYTADKAIRVSSRKSVSSKLLIVEYKKGNQSFGKFMKALEEAQKKIPKDLAINETKKLVLKKASTKKTNSKKSSSKKALSKKTSGKKTLSKNGKK